ncbi:MAG TPA: DinB family protein [Ignavibacteria bacterium]|nr:DinB family protein [Ignavibacteria bacterium]
MKDLLHLYTKYNHWANKQLCLKISEIGNELLDKPVKNSFPSLRKTVYHIWDAEAIWLERLLGMSATDWPSNHFKGDFIEAQDLMLKMSERFVDYIATNDEEFLMSEFSYKGLGGQDYKNKRYLSIMHCMNHSTFHRGQLITILREFDVPDLPGTDLIIYIRENNL